MTANGNGVSFQGHGKILELECGEWLQNIVSVLNTTELYMLNGQLSDICI